MPEGARRKRANGVESRQRILDAAVEIASERGYEGTSIASVSSACGLPASSIYWHFKNKDDLIAAVIERSFDSWLAGFELPGEEAGTPLERVTLMAANVANSLVEAPDFLRLGLMLAMEHRPTEPRGRTVYLQAREIAHRRVSEIIATLSPELTDEAVSALASYAIAGADGLFVDREINGESVDLVARFELHARLVYEAARRWAKGET